MAKHNFKVGDKVVPHTKTAVGYADLDKCPHYQKMKENGQGYLYVVQTDYYHDKQKERILVLNLKYNEEEGIYGGSLYSPSDVTLYEEPVEKVKLPKDLVNFLDEFHKEYGYSLAFMMQFDFLNYNARTNPLLHYLYSGTGQSRSEDFNIDRMLNIVKALKHGYETDNSHIDKLIEELNECHKNGEDIKEITRKLYCTLN